MNIKSITDVITNSSSECFLVRTYGKTPKKILEELKAVGDDGCSGMGGDLGVYNSVSLEGEYGADWKDLDKDFAVIDTDWNKEKLIRWIFKNYFVIDAEDCSVVKDPETKRCLGLSHWDDMKNYPEEWKDVDKNIFSEIAYEKMYADEREDLKDLDTYRKNLQELYKKREAEANKKDTDKYFKENWKQFKTEYPNPDAYIEHWQKAIKNWFDNHPVSVKEKLKYDYDKDKID